MWKTLLVAIFAAIVGGTVATFLGTLLVSHVQAPSSPSLRAMSHWIDIPNPLVAVDEKSLTAIGDFARSLWKKDDLESWLGSHRFKSELRLFKIDLKNDSNVRSGDIELSSDDEHFSFVVQNDASNNGFSQNLRLKYLNPGSGLTVYAVGPRSFFSDREPFDILHAGSTVEILSRNVSDEDIESFEFPRKHPVLAIFLAGLMVISTLIVVLGAPVALASDISPWFRAKLTTQADLGATLKFIGYMREHHPEKFEKPYEPETPPS